MKRLLLAVALSLLTAGSALAQTVILVRHAEKVDASADPLLSEAGMARAEALAVALADLRPELILVTPLQRTRLTAGPTMTMVGLAAVEVRLEGGIEAHVARVVADIRRLSPDSSALVVGHSNTIPAIARALGYAASSDMPDCEYDRLTVLTLWEHEGETDRAAAIVARYGAPSIC